MQNHEMGQGYDTLLPANNGWQFGACQADKQPKSINLEACSSKAAVL
jgi:hypothetical protein